jgi:hypothetical protein
MLFLLDSVRWEKCDIWLRNQTAEAYILAPPLVSQGSLCKFFLHLSSLLCIIVSISVDHQVYEEYYLLIYFFVVLGLELRAFTLSHSTILIFMKGF